MEDHLFATVEIDVDDMVFSVLALTLQKAIAGRIPFLIPEGFHTCHEILERFQFGISCRLLVRVQHLKDRDQLFLACHTHQINFTNEERKWLASHQVLKVANELDWPPFDFAEDGEPKGYTIDLFKLVAKKVGLKFEFINGYTWDELLNKFKNGEIDVLPAVYSNPERRKFSLFTKTYAGNPLLLVVNNKSDFSILEDLIGYTIAVVSGYAITTK